MFALGGIDETVKVGRGGQGTGDAARQTIKCTTCPAEAVFLRAWVDAATTGKQSQQVVVKTVQQ